MNVELCSWIEILEIWSIYLWPNRSSPIEPSSAMLYLGGYSMHNFDFTPSFFCIRYNNKIIGVNSGHMCRDNSYRSRGLWVNEEYRGRGLGVELLLATIQQAKYEQAAFIWSLPRKTSEHTYIKAGFTVTSDWFITETSSSNAYCRLDLQQKV